MANGDIGISFLTFLQRFELGSITEDVAKIGEMVNGIS